MPAEVVWSPVAVDDLDAIREWIADDNDEPTAADTADRTFTAMLDRVEGVACATWGAVTATAIRQQTRRSSKLKTLKG